MFILEKTRRATRTAVERIRDAFIEFDVVAFKEVDIPAEQAYEVVRDGRTYVLAVNDPSLGLEDFGLDCYD